MCKYTDKTPVPFNWWLDFIMLLLKGRLEKAWRNNYAIIRAVFVCLFPISSEVLWRIFAKLGGCMSVDLRIALEGFFFEKVNGPTGHFHFHYITYAPGSRHTTAKSTWRLLLARRVYFLVKTKQQTVHFIHQYSNKLTCRPKKRSADKFDSSDPSYCQFLIKL